MISRDCKEVSEMDFEKVERARQLLNVLELREPKGRVENLMRLLCVKELSKTRVAEAQMIRVRN